MGLPKRRKHFRLGYPEIFGLILLVSLIIMSVAAYTQVARQGWIKTTARVSAVNLPEKYHVLKSPISVTQNGMSVVYEYRVNGRRFTGSWNSNWVSTPMAYSVAPEFIRTLQGVETIAVTNLPRPAENALALEVKSVKQPSAVEAAKSLRGEDYYNVSAIRRKSLAGILPGEVQSPGIMQPTGPVLFIRYNPAQPHQNELNYPGFNFRLPAMIGFVITFMLTLGYFGRYYPALKMRRY